MSETGSLPYLPTSVFATEFPIRDGWIADDENAIRLLRLGSEAKLRIPEDIAVYGMNDIETTENTIPTLTSMRIPFPEMGIMAVKSLKFSWNNLLPIPANPSLRHELIQRDSTRK